MNFQRDDVIGVVGMVWETALGMSVVLDDAPAPAGEPRLVGSVAIGGTCEGEVSVRCDVRLARHAAAVLFAKPEPDISYAEVYDAVGELANMTGGNLKALLPDRCSLSLPTTSEGGELTRDAGETVDFVAGDWPFTLTFSVRQGKAVQVGTEESLGRQE